MFSYTGNSHFGSELDNPLAASLPHKCDVPARFGPPHLCGSEEFWRAPGQTPAEMSQKAGSRSERRLRLLPGKNGCDVLL